MTGRSPQPSTIPDLPADGASAERGGPGWPLILGTLLALSFAVYAPTLQHGFVWDDHEQVVDNPLIREWSNLPLFWKRDILALSRQGGQEHCNYYRPLFYTQYLLYHQWFGLNAAAWHAAAIVVHFFAAAASFVLARKLGLTRRAAWVAALLFVVHPVHGESVSWVAAAFNDPPAAACLMLALAAHITWLQRRSHLALALGCLCYAAALGLKESGLALLLLVPLVDWYVRSPRNLWRTALDYVPYFAALALYVGLEVSPAAKWLDVRPLLGFTLLLAGAWGGAWGYHSLIGVRGGPVRATDWRDRPWPRFVNFAPYLGVTLLYFCVRRITIGTSLGVYEGSTPIGELVPTFPSLLVHYLRLLVWPLHLYPSYPLRYVPDWLDLRAYGAVLLLLVLTAAVGVAAWRRRMPAFAALWVVGCIWPVFNIRSFRPQYLAHQRYLYLAAFGMCLLIAYLLARHVRRRGWRITITALLIACWSASNLYYNRAWASDVALWQVISRVDPRNPAGFDWLGEHARQEGKRLAADNRPNEAAAAFAEAERWFRGAIGADPQSPLGYRNLGLLYHVDFKRPADALSHYQDALQWFAVRPGAYPDEYRDCRLNMAVCQAELGRTGEAIQAFEELARTWPHLPDAASNGALLLVKAGRVQEAESLLLDTLRMREAHRAEIGATAADSGADSASGDAVLLRRIVQFYERTGRPELATPYAVRLQAHKQVPGDP